MQKKYIAPLSELLYFDSDDIIATSSLPETNYHSNGIWDNNRTGSPETNYVRDGVWED